jgi:hypothetical protein
MNMPAPAWAIVVAMFQQKRMDYPATEDGARAWTRATCEQLRYTFPDGGWCAKSAGAGRPQSKDVVARQLAGGFEGWAVLTAAGAQGPRQLTDPPEYVELPFQVAIPVDPVNHLGAGPSDGGGGGGGEDPSDDAIDHLAESLERIVTGLAHMTTAIDALNARFDALTRDGIKLHV